MSPKSRTFTDICKVTQKEKQSEIEFGTMQTYAIYFTSILDFEKKKLFTQYYYLRTKISVDTAEKFAVWSGLANPDVESFLAYVFAS